MNQVNLEYYNVFRYIFEKMIDIVQKDINLFSCILIILINYLNSCYKSSLIMSKVGVIFDSVEFALLFFVFLLLMVLLVFNLMPFRFRFRGSDVGSIIKKSIILFLMCNMVLMKLRTE